jgi:TPR repeat protein
MNELYSMMKCQQIKVMPMHKFPWEFYHLGQEEYNMAFYLFIQATRQDHPKALFIIGLSYEDDDQFFNIAEGYYEQAATLGHADV